MAEYDDNEQRAAHDRARDYAEFANIVQHYDDTARPDHDNIEYDTPDFDGAEYDNNGDIVAVIGIIGGVIYDIADAIEQFGSFNDIPDDYEFNIPDIDDGEPCRYIFLVDLFRPNNWCTRNKPPIAPGDDDYDSGFPDAE